MSLKFIHPFTCIVAGPTGSGKTVFVRKILNSHREMIDPPPEKIIWCYGVYQKAYEEMMREMPFVQLIEGIPGNLDELIDPTFCNLIIIDDLMSECGNDARITNLFTRGSHHRNLSVIFIVQNLFHQAKELRTISLNSHYLIVFKNPRDKLQIAHLGKQLYPGRGKYLQEAYQDATRYPYGYLLIDLKPETQEEYRLRSKIFPPDLTVVYVCKT